MSVWPLCPRSLQSHQESFGSHLRWLRLLPLYTQRASPETIGSPHWPGAQGGTIHTHHFRWESHLSWFYDRGAIKDPAHTVTSKGLSQAINRGPIRKLLPKYANVYVTIHSHGLSAGVRTHYVTTNGVRNGLASPLPS